MSDKAVPSPGFGKGLNLRDTVDVVDPEQAIDAMNVVFSERGTVKQRDGFDEFTASALTNQPDSIATYEKADASYVIVGNGARLTQLDTTGTIVGTQLTTAGASPHFFARYGAPTEEKLFAANGTDEIWMLDGTSAWATPDYEDETNTDVAPKAKFIAVTQTSNRLVGADHRNSTGFSSTDPLNVVSKSTVRFTNAGDPTTWPQNNYVHLTPGDGEQIMGMIAWRELLFVFKETKFFVFYGESTDSTGNPVFNKRAVTSGVGLASSRALCAGSDGVYFLDRHGVYKTTGQDPQLVSDLIDPIFFGGTSTFYQGGELLQSQITNSAMTWHDERVYLSFTTTGTTNNRTLVYDTRYKWWTIWDVAASCLIPFDIAGHKLLFGYAAGANDIGQIDGTDTNDAGVAITSRWQSGWYDYDNPNVKTIRATRVTGEGKPSIGIAHDYQTSATLTQLDFTVSQPLWDVAEWDVDVWGPLPSYKTKSIRQGPRGMIFSTMIQNSTLDQPWTIHRLENQMRGQRDPGTHYIDEAV